MWVAAHLVHNEDTIHNGRTTVKQEVVKGQASFAEKSKSLSSPEELASHVNAWFSETNQKVSKSIAAQYLADLLECRIQVSVRPNHPCHAW